MSVIYSDKRENSKSISPIVRIPNPIQPKLHLLRGLINDVRGRGLPTMSTVEGKTSILVLWTGRGYNAPDVIYAIPSIFYPISVGFLLIE